jgi:predicted nuclease with RNAse H fold
VRTVGVDLATQPSNTALAALDWTAGTATLTSLILPASDAAIVDAVLAADWAGIDAPLGWPEAFHAFLTAHRDGSLTPITADPDDWRRDLSFRATDRAVLATTGQRPLSVAANYLGLTAMRAASLMADLAARGMAVDRDGRGPLLEVYPAAALRVWDLPRARYKDGHPAALGALVDALLDAAPWLDLGPHEARCRVNDDALDAVLASLVTRARALGHWQPPPDTARDLARREGWIVIPTCPLDALPLDPSSRGTTS